MTNPWPIHARQWTRIGSPLRPAAEDVATIGAIVQRATSPRAVLLGVTPEIARQAWPPGTSLVAVDGSPDMIAHVWPSASVPGARVVHGDWRALPVEDSWADLVLGDGIFTVIRYPADTSAVLAEVRRVLASSGRLVARAFVPPPIDEDPAEVIADLVAGRIGSFNAFKVRLTMSLRSPATRSVRLGDAWALWSAHVPEPEALLERLGWSVDLLATIDVYRDSAVAYAYPSIGDLLALARDAFVLEAVHVPSYELGPRCPTLVFRAR